MTLNGGGFSIEKGTLRLGSLITVILGVCGALVVMVDYKVNMQRDITDINLKLTAIANERFRRSDMAEWCRESERRNADFDCPDPYQLPSFVARSTRGWAK